MKLPDNSQQHCHCKGKEVNLTLMLYQAETYHQAPSAPCST